MHWPRLGVTWFLVFSVGVNSKCFDPTMKVTMADGSRKALMEVQYGDEVKSWNFKTNSSTTSIVAGILKFQRESLMELLLETGDTIYSTYDHPYWSHTKQCMVSRDPSSTLSLYEIPASQLDDEEVFVNVNHEPVAGRVTGGRRTASVIMDGVEVPDTMEVMTLHLNGSHWFYVQGILVHNKGGGGGDSGIRKGGLSGGYLLEGTHGYRRRRGNEEFPNDLDTCYVINKYHENCLDDDNWDRATCQVESQKEYEDHKACYDCKDDDCIRRICGSNAEVCNPAMTSCTCCGCREEEEEEESDEESDGDDRLRLLHESGSEHEHDIEPGPIHEKCFVETGPCSNGSEYTSCCACFHRMMNNLVCDEEPEETSIFPVVVAIIGGVIFVLVLIKVAVDEARKKCCPQKGDQGSE